MSNATPPCEPKATLYIVGLGLSRQHLTLEAAEVLSQADIIFLETYTSIVPEDLVEKLKNACKHAEVRLVTRKELEDEDGKPIFECLRREENVVLAVPGDPFIATTHSYIRLKALKEGYRVRYVPGINIFSYAISVTGLFVYKFGRSATIVYPRENILSEHPYLVLEDNKKRGLHTFFFLDLDLKLGPMTPDRAVTILLELEQKLRRNVVNMNDKIVVLERMGSKDESIYYASVEYVMKHSWRKPPYSIIYPGRLHFMEEEALEVYRVE